MTKFNLTEQEVYTCGIKYKRCDKKKINGRKNQ